MSMCSLMVYSASSVKRPPPVYSMC